MAVGHALPQAVGGGVACAWPVPAEGFALAVAPERNALAARDMRRVLPVVAVVAVCHSQASCAALAGVPFGIVGGASSWRFFAPGPCRRQRVSAGRAAALIVANTHGGPRTRAHVR